MMMTMITMTMMKEVFESIPFLAIWRQQTEKSSRSLESITKHDLYNICFAFVLPREIYNFGKSGNWMYNILQCRDKSFFEKF